MNIFKAAILLFVLVSCQPPVQEASVEKTGKVLPKAMQKVIDNHGGLEQWQKMRAMSFELVKETGNELQEIDLYTREERIEGNNFITGYDGKQVWVKADSTYKGNVVFYHNLMFYFVAMPFVLADDGIIYSDVDDLVFGGKIYPGIRISYQSDIGFSPEDEYFIHYDAETNEMAWLGYTVTYFSGKKTENIKWIRYDDWIEKNGLKLPNSMTWYVIEDGIPTEVRKRQDLIYKTLSEEAFASSKFVKPSGGEYAE